MTDEMEWPDRKDRPGLRAPMVRTAVQEASDRLARRVLAEMRESGVPTGHAVPMAHLARLDPPVSPASRARQDRPGLLDRAVRRANVARRGSRALRAILARLVKRANL